MYCCMPLRNLKIMGKTIQSMARLQADDIYIDATDEGLSLRAVNGSRSGYMSFLFRKEFFSTWHSGQNVTENTGRKDQNDTDDATSGSFCKISMKSALIIHKASVSLEKVIESCSISIDVDEWRLVFELQCREHVVRKYKMVLLTCAGLHLAVDKTSSKSIISTPGELFVNGIQQNFHTGQDEVTLSVTSTDLNLKNYVDNSPNQDRGLKTQLHLDKSEFDQFQIQTEADITFCMKELRSLLVFIETYHLPVVIRFDEPGAPITFSVEADPAFVGDLVLATFIECESSQTSERATQETHLSSQVIGSVSTDVDSTVQSRHSQIKNVTAKFQRVSVCASMPVRGISAMKQNFATAPSSTMSRSSNKGRGGAKSDTTKSTLGIESANVYEEEEEHDGGETENRDRYPTTPPLKRSRKLFEGWSQMTGVSSQSSDRDQMESAAKILAFDSDIEDI